MFQNPTTGERTDKSAGNHSRHYGQPGQELETQEPEGNAFQAMLDRHTGRVCGDQLFTAQVLGREKCRNQRTGAANEESRETGQSPDWHETWYNATLGHEKGYPVSILGYRIGREWAGKSLTRFAAAYMEDGSRTWREAGTNDSGPLHTAAFPGGNLIEESDGTLVIPVYGYQTGADIGIHL